MIPFLDLNRINEPLRKDFERGFNLFLNSGHYILGQHVKCFEDDFAKYCGAKFCVGTGNGLEGLALILRGYLVLGKLKEGDKVLVAANTYIATILSIVHAGLKPVLVEPDVTTFNISPHTIKKHIDNNVKVILPTHLYGQLADMDSINKIAKSEDLLVISDAAQGHGARDVHGNLAGNLCNAAAFSFYPTKNLGALGDAGAITTNDYALVQVLIKIRNYGASSKYVNDHLGWNSRLDELQAVFLSEKLPFLDQNNRERRRIASRYLNEITNRKIKLPFWDGSENHVFHLFVVRVTDRAKFCTFLEDKGVGFLIHYPIPPHKQKALDYLSNRELPITEKIHREVVSLPLYPGLKNSEITEIVNVVNAWK